MKDKLRDRVAGVLSLGNSAKTLIEYASAGEKALQLLPELLEILDAEGDGGAVGSMRALLIKALTDYRCTRTVDEDGEPLPLVDALSPGEGGTIQSGTEELEFLAEYLADELPLPTPHPARSGVVSDEDMRDAAVKRVSAQLQAQGEILFDKWWLVEDINKRADEILREGERHER